MFGWMERSSGQDREDGSESQSLWMTTVKSDDLTEETGLPVRGLMGVVLYEAN